MTIDRQSIVFKLEDKIMAGTQLVSGDAIDLAWDLLDIVLSDEKIVESFKAVETLSRINDLVSIDYKQRNSATAMQVKAIIDGTENELYIPRHVARAESDAS